MTDHTLFWATTYAGIQGTNPLSGDPRFVNPAGGDYHLGPGSEAIDAELDIGADEVQGLPCWRVRLPLVMRNYSG